MARGGQPPARCRRPATPSRAGGSPAGPGAASGDGRLGDPEDLGLGHAGVMFELQGGDDVLPPPSSRHRPVKVTIAPARPPSSAPIRAISAAVSKGSALDGDARGGGHSWVGSNDPRPGGLRAARDAPAPVTPGRASIWHAEPHSPACVIGWHPAEKDERVTRPDPALRGRPADFASRPAGAGAAAAR